MLGVQEKGHVLSELLGMNFQGSNPADALEAMMTLKLFHVLPAGGGEGQGWLR